jgi:hypothetical protein
MKKIAVVFLALICATRLCAQNNPPTRGWDVTLKVVDETGTPVSGAEASVSYFVQPPAQQPRDSVASENIAGLTDANGVFEASHNDRSISLTYRVQKNGYYKTEIVDHLGRPDQHGPATWTSTVTMQLKKVGQPIAMYAKKIRLAPAPRIQNTPIGYDLIMGDWTTPYGKGQKADIIFLKEFQGKAPYDYLSRLTVSFTNPGDGIQAFTVPFPPLQGSLLRSPHEAPLDGYQPQLIKEDSAHPGQPSKEAGYDEAGGYFIRVQTILDANGNVKSALYGKIYGDFMQFSYYLNPTPNDRNIEFNPKQNLLKSLKSSDHVLAP